MKFYRQSARFKTGFLRVLLTALAICCALQASPASVQEAPSQPPPESAWRVVLVGVLHAQNAQTEPIPGAKDTKFAAAWAANAEGVPGRPVVYLSQEKFAALGVDWAVFRAKSAAAASAELASLQPELIRDANQVIECAIFHSKCPVDDITAAILAPDFLKRFTPLFGRKMLLAIPDRRTVYLFPRLASRYPNYAERVLAVYRKSECPVSREVFELSAEGLRAIGAYAEP